MRSSMELIVIMVAFLSIWMTASIFTFPHLSRDVCIVDERLKAPHYISAIDEVVELLNKEGLDITRSCEDSTSIKLYLGPLPRPKIARAGSQGIARDGKPFVPLIRKLDQTILFKEKNKLFKNERYFKLTFIHELGHILGIGHVDNAYHIMSPSITGLITVEEAVKQIKELSYAKFDQP